MACGYRTKEGGGGRWRKMETMGWMMEQKEEEAKKEERQKWNERW